MAVKRFGVQDHGRLPFRLHAATSGPPNVKYGQDSLTAFLDRYVIGHKAAHVEQLRSTIAAVTG